MTGSMFSFESDNEHYQGYLATGKSAGKGVVVLQEWWGLVDHIKGICDRFAEAGYTALAPDLYKGDSTTSPDAAGKKMMALNINETEVILRGAIGALQNHEMCSSDTVGVVGFCMGGQLSLFAAAANPKNVSACVDYYGIHPDVHPPFENLQAPVLGFFAEHDGFVNAEAVSLLAETLEKNEKQYDFTTYPDTDHAFFNSTREEVYNEQAANDSWTKMLEFFNKSIR